MFYRVVNGIRTGQALQSGHAADNGGFKITNESLNHTKSSEDQPRWPMESVTPSESSEEIRYAQTNMHCELPEQLQHILSTDFETRPKIDDIDDGWSITGYDEVPSQKKVAVVEDDDIDDDGVFSMEL